MPQQISGVSFVYMTSADKTEALRIGRILVEEQLAACINVFEGMTSVYRWEGVVEEAHEAVLIAKTRTDLVRQLVQRVAAAHSYSCPCVVSWPIADGNADYLQWIQNATDSS